MVENEKLKDIIQKSDEIVLNIIMKGLSLARIAFTLFFIGYTIKLFIELYKYLKLPRYEKNLEEFIVLLFYLLCTIFASLVAISKFA